MSSDYLIDEVDWHHCRESGILFEGDASSLSLAANGHVDVRHVSFHQTDQVRALLWRRSGDCHTLRYGDDWPAAIPWEDGGVHEKL